MCSAIIPVYDDHRVRGNRTAPTTRITRQASVNFTFPSTNRRELSTAFCAAWLYIQCSFPRIFITKKPPLRRPLLPFVSVDIRRRDDGTYPAVIRPSKSPNLESKMWHFWNSIRSILVFHNIDRTRLKPSSAQTFKIARRTTAGTGRSATTTTTTRSSFRAYGRG